MHAQLITDPIPRGHTHDPQSQSMQQTNEFASEAEFAGSLYGQSQNAATEWQPIRAQLGPSVANGPYGLDAKNPFVGVGYYHVKET